MQTTSNPFVSSTPSSGHNGVATETDSMVTPDSAVSVGAEYGGLGNCRTLEARVDLIERRIIEDCLQRNNHRRKETAAELGISRVTLYNKMKKFGLMG